MADAVLISLSAFIACLVALYCSGSQTTLAINRRANPPRSDVNSTQEEA